VDQNTRRRRRAHRLRPRCCPPRLYAVRPADRDRPGLPGRAGRHTGGTCRPGRAGAGAATPILKGKPTALATVRGGGYGPGTPREGWDHSTTPYLRRVPADMREADLTVVERELTLAGVNPALDGLRDLAAKLHSDALGAAHDASQALTIRLEHDPGGRAQSVQAWSGTGGKPDRPDPAKGNRRPGRSAKLLTPGYRHVRLSAACGRSPRRRDHGPPVFQLRAAQLPIGGRFRGDAL
jgi:hypothetical protein